MIKTFNRKKTATILLGLITIIVFNVLFTMPILWNDKLPNGNVEIAFDGTYNYKEKLNVIEMKNEKWTLGKSWIDDESFYWEFKTYKELSGPNLVVEISDDITALYTPTIELLTWNNGGSGKWTTYGNTVAKVAYNAEVNKTVITYNKTLLGGQMADNNKYRLKFSDSVIGDNGITRSMSLKFNRL